jgi:hypothetical protein
VKYVYGQNAAPPEEPDAPAVLDPGMMRTIPEPLRQRLREALESLDSDSIAGAIDETAELDSKLAGVLSRLADKFDYLPILKVLETRC